MLHFIRWWTPSPPASFNFAYHKNLLPWCQRFLGASAKVGRDISLQMDECPSKADNEALPTMKLLKTGSHYICQAKANPLQPKSVKHSSSKCASQFFRSRFESRRGVVRRQSRTDCQGQERNMGANPPE